MNKRYWMLPKITPREIYEMFLTDADRQRIKRDGERAMRTISSFYGMCVGFELERMMRR